jgi:hypothetical protein
MSLLSSFLSTHLIPALESAFIAHEPEAQAALLAELSSLADQVSAWLESKLAPKA